MTLFYPHYWFIEWFGGLRVVYFPRFLIFSAAKSVWDLMEKFMVELGNRLMSEKDIGRNWHPRVRLKRTVD